MVHIDYYDSRTKATFLDYELDGAMYYGAALQAGLQAELCEEKQ